MSDMIRIVARVRVSPDQRDLFIEKIEELVRQCEANEPETIGIEWFLNDANEAVVIDSYQNSDAFLAHIANVGEIAQEISQIAPSFETLIFGSPNDTVRTILSKMGAKFFQPAAGFNRALSQ